MKIQKALKLSRDVIDDIDRRKKEEDFNFSNWVEVTYIKQNMTEYGLKKSQKKHERLAKKFKNLAYALKRKRQIRLKNLLDKTVKGWLKTILETREILKKSPNLINGRLKYFNNTFKTNLTMFEFKDLLNSKEVEDVENGHK